MVCYICKPFSISLEQSELVAEKLYSQRPKLEDKKSLAVAERYMLSAYAHRVQKINPNTYLLKPESKSLISDLRQNQGQSSVDQSLSLISDLGQSQSLNSTQNQSLRPSSVDQSLSLSQRQSSVDQNDRNGPHNECDITIVICSTESLIQEVLQGPFRLVNVYGLCSKQIAKKLSTVGNWN
jgi:hypothetical protein